jgi:glycosyltransferase involved in cell wall biosynthesis
MDIVSVVITAYNSMDYLPETLESVLRQTFTDFEVLLVDDGSSDHIVQWASGLVDPRVRLISQENQGVSVARNTGIAHTQGKYVAFLDGDDLWEPTKLEKQVRCLEENPEVGLVHTWLTGIDRHSKPTGRVICSQIEGEVWQKIVEKNRVACSSAMVRRCCFETVGVFDKNLRFAEDWDMWIRLATRYHFAVIKEPLVGYREHSNSKSKKYASKLQDFQTIIEKAFETAPFELLHIRNRSYAHINLCIAWKCLQGSEIDYKSANHFRRLATLHYPQLRYSQEYLRLSLAIAMMQWFGPKSYSRLLALFYILRQRLSMVSHAVAVLIAHVLAMPILIVLVIRYVFTKTPAL